MTIKLYLVRHGHTVVADSGTVAGHTDVELSELGIQQLTTLQQSKSTCRFDYCISSDLKRTKLSAALLQAKNCHHDVRLRELNFGDWEGMTWDEVYQRDNATFDWWSENWVDRAPPNGETFLQLANRCGEWLEDLVSTENEKDILVVAHGGSIRALLCLALELPLASAMKFSIDHAHVSKLILSENANRCAFVNRIGWTA